MFFLLTPIWFLLFARSSAWPPGRDGVVLEHMVDSILSRHQQTIQSGKSLSLIEQGIFQSAIQTILASGNLTAAQQSKYTAALSASIQSVLPALSDPANLTRLPLDRLSIGTTLLRESGRTHTADENHVIISLYTSLGAQKRNADGSLWYYDNAANQSAYHNLTYTDGIFSLAPFLISYESTVQPVPPPVDAAAPRGAVPLAGLSAVLQQVQLLLKHCQTPSGLVVHGFDPSFSHAWSHGNRQTGASPLVWGRAQGWFSVGIVDALAATPTAHRNREWIQLRNIWRGLANAQASALNAGRTKTHRAGVWQVVERQGDAGNWIESSASALWAYALLKGARLRFLDKSAVNTVTSEAVAVWQSLRDGFVKTDGPGIVSLTDTSAVASLSPDVVDYQYYITRNRTVDSLVGEAAFVLLGNEIELILASINAM